MSRDTLICLALGCLTLVLFAPTRHHAFINYDDPGYVREPHVQQGLTPAGVRWAFTTFQFSNYHPLTWLSHMADVSLFGADNPGGHHLSSVAIHAVNAVLLYLLLRTMTARAWESVAVATLWAIHPLRVESVAWVAERKDLLCGLFVLLAIAAYVRYAQRRSWIAYAASVSCFAMALMSKSMAVTLPCVLLLLDCWPLKRDAGWKRLVVEKLPFFALTVAFAVLTVIAQRQGGAMPSDEHYPLALRIGNAFASLASYLRMTVWPTGLAVFYPYYGAIENTRLPAARVAIGVALLLAGTLLGIATWWRERAVLIGWLWFLGTLVPVIGLVQVGRAAMADRYTYIPHVGLFIAIVWGVAAMLRGRASGTPLAAGVAAVVVVAVALAARTLDQLGHWRDSGTLFSHAMRVTENNPVAHANLATYLSEERGDTAAALQLYLRATEIVPREAGPYYHAARLLAAQGQHDQAVRYFRESLAREPESFLAHYDLAVELAEHGKVHEALPHFEQAVRLRPEQPEVHYAYALALRKAGDAARAQAAYDRYLELARRRRGATTLPLDP